MNDHDALPPDSAANAERYADTRHVLHGPDGPGVLRTVLYATYVGALLAATYGYTVARGIFATSDREWLRSVLLSPGAALALGAAVVGVVLVAFRAGQVRGPVVPPLPWTDLVVTSALDRPLVLRDWWLVSSTLAVVGGVLGGGVVGAGLWGAGAAGGLALVGGLVGGAAVGGAAVWAWLLGEARDPAYAVRGRVVVARPRRVLADLRMGTLRAQGVRTTHLGGAILAGDLRAARLEVASPIRRARRARLRAGRPWTTMARRDLLGLRRQAVTGVIMTAAAGAALGWGLAIPAVPPGIVVLAGVLAYLGVGWWCEGLRLGADTSGTPPLFGLTPRLEALAHTVVPTIAAIVVLVLSGGGVAAAQGANVLVAAAWLGACAVILIALQVVAAYRGQPPTGAFLPESGPTTLVFFMARSVLAAGLFVGGLTSLAGHVGMPRLWSVIALAVVITVTWALSRQRALTLDHRQ